MFIGHLPGAYLIFRAATPSLGKLALTAALIGSVAPDVDILWFYLIDNRGHHHHSYLTHRPIIWAGFLVVGLLLRHWAPKWGTAIQFFGIGGLVHLVLDSITGQVAWLWPISDTTYPLVTVQPTHSHWILSFLNHWTFKVEIAIAVVALIVLFIGWRRSSKRYLSLRNKKPEGLRPPGS